MTWTLIVFFLHAGYVYTTEIDTYKSEQQCERAGKHLAKLYRHAGKHTIPIEWVCEGRKDRN